MKLANPLRFLTLAAVLCGSIAAQADTVTFVTPTGSATGGGPVNASATFTTAANAITIVLKNLQANPTDVAQNVSDLFFSVSTGQTAGTVASTAGVLRTIAANGTFTDAATTAAGWGLTFGSGQFHLDDLNGNAGPNNTLIGPPGGATYSNANGSIAGNGPHNPFLAETVTFNLTVTGVTASTKITGATFSFGTVSGVNIVGTPEPATWAIGLAMSFVGLVYWGRKQLSKVQTAGI
jgi:hypothetical protein